MPPKRGRPSKEDSSGDAGTRMVRLYNDVADMVGWIVELEGGTAAQLLDPLIRAAILARYKRIEPQVIKIKKAREEAKRKPTPGE